MRWGVLRGVLPQATAADQAVYIDATSVHANSGTAVPAFINQATDDTRGNGAQYIIPTETGGAGNVRNGQRDRH